MLMGDLVFKARERLGQIKTWRDAKDRTAAGRLDELKCMAEVINVRNAWESNSGRSGGEKNTHLINM